MTDEAAAVQRLHWRLESYQGALLQIQLVAHFSGSEDMDTVEDLAERALRKDRDLSRRAQRAGMVVG